MGAPTGQGQGPEPGYYVGARIVGMTTADKGAMAEIRDEAGVFVYDGAGSRGPFASTAEALAFRKGLADGKP